MEVSRGPQKEIPDLVTQRAVLSHVSAVFDPLGLFAPYTMRMRILLKSVWIKCGQQWDKELSKDEIDVFYNWANELQQIKDFSIDRNYFANTVEQYQLHIFCDASLEAMCIVAYLREDTQEESELAFVIGKSRIAPMRQLSIPRLELQAAMYATRLRDSIIAEHDLVFSKIYHWSDSMTVLHWLHSSHKKQTVFVAN